MKIEDLQETAALAHLNLKDEELAAAFPAFEQMLGFFAAMQAADEDTGAFSASITGLSRQARTVDADFFRKDASEESLDSSNKQLDGLNEKLLNNAGERDGRFILVPNVL
jgi:aspartyl-tRNA(Asn)/glutamyl-tRNA(Gln) amidotransferase subunit C